jgi:hypothetical protein
MQTIINNNELDKSQYPVKIYFGDYEISKEIRIVDFMKKTETGESIITLSSVYFTKGAVSVQADVINKRLKLVISEFIDLRQKVWTPVNDWEQFTGHSYTRMHNIRIMLPGDNFYILRHIFIPEESLLKVVLGISYRA